MVFTVAVGVLRNRPQNKSPEELMMIFIYFRVIIKAKHKKRKKKNIYI